ncbi:MAG TPA: phospholipid carrier-dependent glycosyltransferase [Phycisphaerae bacterium]|nr:phospholipid carrier-dependent glycosyltransferase [Phycisphaerae bacterium]
MKSASITTGLLFLLIYLIPLGQRPLIAPDEARYCEIPREMIHSGEWIVPHLNGLRYFEKPVLGYWVIAASMMAFGENAFAARLPSALATGISAILIGLLVRRAGARKTTCALASAAFLTSIGVFGVGTFNVLDSMFSMLVTASAVCSYWWHSEGNRRTRTVALACLGGLAGLAFLLKGLAAFACVILIMLPFAIWQRRGKEFIRTAWLPAAAALLVCLPWCIAIAIREPDFARRFFWIEHFQRFTGSANGQHSFPIWYFIPLLLLGTLPWNIFAATTIAGLRTMDLREPFLRFIVCWAVFPFLFFSLSRGKLGTYILPCYPPIVILGAMGVARYLESGKVKVFNVGLIVAAALTATGLLFVLMLRKAHPFGLVFFAPTEAWRAGLAVLGLSAWFLLLIMAVKVKEYRYKLALFCEAPLVTLMLVPLIFPAAHYADRAPGHFLRKHSDRIGPATVLVSDSTLAHAVCWFYKRDDVRILAGRAGELEYGLSYNDSCHRLLDFTDFLGLVNAKPGSPPVILILTTPVRDTYVRYLRSMNWADRLPPVQFEDAEDGLWIAEFNASPKQASARSSASAPPLGRQPTNQFFSARLGPHLTNYSSSAPARSSPAEPLFLCPTNCGNELQSPRRHLTLPPPRRSLMQKVGEQGLSTMCALCRTASSLEREPS